MASCFAASSIFPFSTITTRCWDSSTGRSSRKGLSARTLFFLAAQHNEYKLFFAHGVAWVQLAAAGHVNFSCLCVLGDAAVFALALILWRMFLPGPIDPAKRLAFFVPVAWLLFQLEYWETLDWAMASLENLWVVVFSLGAICCLLRPTRKAFAGALVLYALAVAASGNGFLLLPVGLLILVRRRCFARAAGWLAVSASHRRVRLPLQRHVVSIAVARIGVRNAAALRPEYAIAFAGNAGAVAGKSPVSIGVILALGASLLGLFGWLARRGYGRRNPFVSCSVLFVLLTALGVAGLRSEFGLTQSLEPATPSTACCWRSWPGPPWPRNSCSTAAGRCSTTLHISQWQP